MKSGWTFWMNRLCMLCLAVILAQSAHAAPALSLATVNNSVLTGMEINVDVQVNEILDLYGYQFTLLFDPSILQVSAGHAGTFLNSAGANYFDGGIIDNVNGSVSYVLGSLQGAVFGANGSGTLASFHFMVTGAGKATLGWADTLLLDSTLSAITVQSTSVVLTAVPEPSVVWLMLAGLPLLAMSRRRSSV